MRCAVCGNEMKNTIGGNYYCPICGHAMNDLVNRPSNCDMPMPQGFGEQGWICPVCGRGLAPWMSFCPCQGSEIKITYGTTIKEELNSLSDYYQLLEKKMNCSEDNKDLLEG